MTVEGERHRRMFGKSVQATEEQLLEEPRLSCPLHMVPSLFYMDHQLLLSPLSNHTCLPNAFPVFAEGVAVM